MRCAICLLLVANERLLTSPELSSESPLSKAMGTTEAGKDVPTTEDEAVLLARRFCRAGAAGFFLCQQERRRQRGRDPQLPRRPGGVPRAYAGLELASLVRRRVVGPPPSDSQAQSSESDSGGVWTLSEPSSATYRPPPWPVAGEKSPRNARNSRGSKSSARAQLVASKAGQHAQSLVCWQLALSCSVRFCRTHHVLHQGHGDWIFR